MIFRYFLDGTEYENPGGWDDLNYSIQRDKTLNGILATIDGTFTFTGPSYDYLRGLFDSQGFCTLVEVKIFISDDDGSTYTVLYEGLVFISDIKFDELRREAKTKIQDDSFYAKIYNNKSIGCLFHVPISKKTQTITAAPRTTVSFFNPADGVYYANSGTRGGTCYRVFDAFQFLVDFMTDGTVGFVSDTFDTGGDWDGLMVTTGYVLANVQAGLNQSDFESNWPLIQFDTMLKEVHKKINIGFIIERAGSTNTLRIESQDYFRSQATGVTFTDIGQITSYVAADQVYSKLKIGSGATVDAGYLSFPEQTEWVGFKEEEYSVVLDCNIDKTLDLLGEWGASSNAIEDAVVNADTTNEEVVFLIKATKDPYGVYYADQSNWLTNSPPAYYYNEALTNASTAARFYGAVPGPIASYLSSIDNTFNSTKGADDLVPTPPGTGIVIDYDTEISDPGTNYDDINFRYNIPLSGQYHFEAWAKFKMQGVSVSTDVVATLYARLYTSVGALIASYQIDTISFTYNTTTPYIFTLYGVADIVASITDRVQIELDFTSTGVPPANPDVYKMGYGYFRCTQTPDGGGIYNTYDPAQYPIIQHEFTNGLSYTNWQTIIGDPKKLVSFAMNGQQPRYGWIDTIKYNPFKGEAKFILSSSKEINT